tara:strand:+ start:10432 stop:13647 length:3216 start_codon:yes stop_codon:yes gene_type:complete
MNHSFQSALLFAISGLVFAPWGLADELDFNRDVRPILSDKCYFCHGPDAGNREAGLRLDVRDEAIDYIESGEVLDRIHSDDPDVLMPPPTSKLSLTSDEKRILNDWIDQGAKYQTHWSFEPLPMSVDVPQMGRSQWCKQTIDRFVLARLDQEGLGPNPAASPLRWFRRVTLDLTGLPPTKDDIDKFNESLAGHATAASPDGIFETVVDRLLQSPAFGEHMSISWLDAARYADSYGYQSDKLNTQWPYRDWVVRALNQNLPYDDFLTWQLAGDLLPNPTRDQKLATAFNRIHRLNNEGGAVFEEWRIENVADRVHTFGTAVLGLTMECCRCHDHKYDPLPMRDYYALSAFFNSIDESGVYDRTEKVPCPSMLLPTPQQEQTLADARAKMQQAEFEYRKTYEAAVERFAAWESPGAERIQIPDLRLALGFEYPYQSSMKELYHPSESDRRWSTMPAQEPVKKSPIAMLDPATAADNRIAKPSHPDDPEDAPKRMALRLDGERGITTKGIEPFDRWKPFSLVVTLQDTKRTSYRSVIAHHTRGTDCGYNGWDLTIQSGRLESRLARVWPGNAIAVATVDAIPANAWHQVAATYDGSSTANGLKLYLDGVQLDTVVLRDEVKKQANVKVDHGGELVIGQRFRDRGFDGGWIDDVQLFDRALTAPELLQLVDGQSLQPTPEYYASAVDPLARRAMAELTKARQEFVLAEEVINEIPVMREMQEARPAHILARGQYDAPTDESTLVQRDIPSQLALPFPANATRDRLGLAKWVTDPRHPLTSRVAVNRIWGNFFSEPLVRTPENFGSQGELPTHPQLLDWLARDFVDGGWDVKRLCKQIVLSATYRQDSRTDRSRLSDDPDNRLLARGPSNRLSAEQIRDLALAASGLIDQKLGGAPVSPYQPGEDLWRESNGMSPPYQQSVGKSLYRRSLYSVWKRTAPLPNMLALDATTREVCTMARSRTNTPLQALVLMNDVQFVESARVLAASVMSESDDAPRRVQNAFASLAGRSADEQELQTLMTLLDAERDYFQRHPQQAVELISVGQAPIATDLEAPELAAMTIVCQSILNLDATVWKR